MRRTPVGAGTLGAAPLARSVAVGACCAIATLLVCSSDARGLLAPDPSLPDALPSAWVLLAGLTVLLGAPAAWIGLGRTTRRGPVGAPVVAAASGHAHPRGPVAPDPLATLSHEIRTPLNALLGMTELLLSGSLDPWQRDQVGRLRNSGLQILGLVDDVLDHGSVQAGRLTVADQPFELSELLADVVEVAHVDAAAKGIRLHVELDPGCAPWVRGDLARLRQVLVNLVGNAVKFSDAGVVTLEVCRAARTEPSSALYFQVTDTGGGFPPDRAREIFEPWSRLVPHGRARPPGAGLGLPISQALVRGMGGEIVATSQEGVGTVFGFEVVLPPAPVPTTVATALGGRRVVLLDHQPLRAARTALRMREWGAEVEVGHPRDLDAGEPDLVVLWEDRPDELAALVARRRRHRAPGPLVIVTADAHTLPAQALTRDDVVVGATPAGRRLRAALTALVRSRADGPGVGAGTPTLGDPPLRVLLAEDDPTSRSVCAMLVRRLGHEVDVVVDGAAAVRAIASTTYDLVLMDSQMPGLDGVDATRLIRSDESPDRRVRVVALTGALGPADQAVYALAGMDDVLAKPLSLDTLARVLADVPRAGRVPVLADQHHG